jgi:predicted amidohydrolase YtcJ
VAVGSTDEVTAQVPGARVIDVAGRSVLPGFIDAHNHALATGESLASLDARYPAVRSIEELLTRIRVAATTTPAGRWITASGFDSAQIDRDLTRWDLDRATIEHPVAVHHVSGHHVYVNSVALAQRQVNERTPDPVGGRLVRDATGQLTGLCLDTAMSLILPVAVDIGGHGPNFHTTTTLDESVDAVERATRAFLAAGLTTVCDPQVTAREMSGYREARRTGRLHTRMVCMPLSHQLDALLSLGLAGPFGDDWLSLGAMKFYADGSLIGGTACFHDGSGAPGSDPGSMYWTGPELQERITQAHLGGWQVGVHVQGDQAMGLVLDALEHAAALAPRDHRHRLEHAGYPTVEQVGRIAALGAITVNQPNYLHDSGDAFLDRMGSRAHELQPWVAELTAGVRVVLSSDSDVTSYNPLHTVRTAMDRRTRAGTVLGPGQQLSLVQALHAHTSAAAHALRMDDRLGSLETGKIADLVVIDGDLTASSAAEIGDLQVWLTVLDGRTVYAAATAPG